jgi:hypothetical protein
MCLDTVTLRAEMNGLSAEFVGYKVFSLKDYKLFNHNSSKIEYASDRWYEAKIDGDGNVGSDLADRYPLGFHTFINLDDVEQYKRKCGWDNSPTVKIKFKEILAFGKQYDSIIIVARHMYIPFEWNKNVFKPVVHLSNLVPGQKFKREGSSSVFTF